MTSLIDWLTTQLNSNPILVAVVVGALAAAESLIIVGSIVPGTTILLAVAAATGATGHSLWPMFFAASAGAVLGDGVSYWIGRHYGERISRWGPLARRPHLLLSAETSLRRRGVASIFVARFVPGLRTLIPAAAGILGMGPSRFAAANIPSGVLWAAVHILGTGLAGAIISRVGERHAELLVAAIIALGLAIWFARLIARGSPP